MAGKKLPSTILTVKVQKVLRQLLEARLAEYPFTAKVREKNHLSGESSILDTLEYLNTISPTSEVTYFGIPVFSPPLRGTQWIVGFRTTGLC